MINRLLIAQLHPLVCYYSTYSTWTRRDSITATRSSAIKDAKPLVIAMPPFYRTEYRDSAAGAIILLAILEVNSFT
ncbi:MAG: hypothetical protein PHE15_06010 [Dehalococcoidales bacterium]|nr:hypothetical protein [Dehalococcoidales bacterium]